MLLPRVEAAEHAKAVGLLLLLHGALLLRGHDALRVEHAAVEDEVPLALPLRQPLVVDLHLMAWAGGKPLVSAGVSRRHSSAHASRFPTREPPDAIADVGSGARGPGGGAHYPQLQLHLLRRVVRLEVHVRQGQLRVRVEVRVELHALRGANPGASSGEGRLREEPLGFSVGKTEERAGAGARALALKPVCSWELPSSRGSGGRAKEARSACLLSCAVVVKGANDGGGGAGSAGLCACARGPKKPTHAPAERATTGGICLSRR